MLSALMLIQPQWPRCGPSLLAGVVWLIVAEPSAGAQSGRFAVCESGLDSGLIGFAQAAESPCAAIVAPKTRSPENRFSNGIYSLNVWIATEGMSDHYLNDGATPLWPRHIRRVQRLVSNASWLPGYRSVIEQVEEQPPIGPRSLINQFGMGHCYVREHQVKSKICEYPLVAPRIEQVLNLDDRVVVTFSGRCKRCLRVTVGRTGFEKIEFSLRGLPDISSH